MAEAYSSDDNGAEHVGRSQGEASKTTRTDGRDVTTPCGARIWSTFNSGNLASIYQRGFKPTGGSDTDADSEEEDTDGMVEFHGSTLPDCAGTRFERQNRTWFSFRMCNVAHLGTFRVVIHNMNKQLRLYRQGLEPIVFECQSETQCEVGDVSKWFRGCSNVQAMFEDESFELSFEYTPTSTANASTVVSFAFCYPWTLHDNDSLLHEIQHKITTFNKTLIETQQQEQQHKQEQSSTVRTGATAAHDLGSLVLDDVDRTPLSGIYFHRELLIRSKQGRPVELLTITSGRGQLETREPCISSLFPGGAECVRPHAFEGKKVFVVTARVHPGETPGSHVMNGVLKFITNTTDPRAQAARDTFVFKVVPILNPDGVAAGHYRCDTIGQNLNRFYNSPTLDKHPTVYAAKLLAMYYNTLGVLEYYVDLHGHATKRGCFFYGNCLEAKRQVDNVMYAKLVSLNSPHLDFLYCNFSEKNMFSADKRDGQSKDGSGRVGTFLATDITHCYTLECNYNTGRQVNELPMLPLEAPPALRNEYPITGATLPYTVKSFEDVGRAVVVAALDMREKNPLSRVPASDWPCLSVLRSWVTSILRSNNKFKGSTAAGRGKIGVARRRVKPELAALADTIDKAIHRDARHPSRRQSQPVPQPSSSSFEQRAQRLTSAPVTSRRRKGQTREIDGDTGRRTARLSKHDARKLKHDQGLSYRSSASTSEQPHPMCSAPTTLTGAHNTQLTKGVIEREERTPSRLATAQASSAKLSSPSTIPLSLRPSPSTSGSHSNTSAAPSSSTSKSLSGPMIPGVHTTFAHLIQPDQTSSASSSKSTPQTSPRVDRRSGCGLGIAEFSSITLSRVGSQDETGQGSLESTVRDSAIPQPRGCSSRNSISKAKERLDNDVKGGGDGQRHDVLSADAKRVLSPRHSLPTHHQQQQQQQPRWSSSRSVRRAQLESTSRSRTPSSAKLAPFSSMLPDKSTKMVTKSTRLTGDGRVTSPLQVQTHVKPQKEKTKGVAARTSRRSKVPIRSSVSAQQPSLDLSIRSVAQSSQRAVTKSKATRQQSMQQVAKVTQSQSRKRQELSQRIQQL
eukprot:m.108436 g.108436  ORF g.108436 m.108436 type:complete len:1076 (+) comp13346_c0_seq3:116-3343(+)